jgi:hypothetical protein
VAVVVFGADRDCGTGVYGPHCDKHGQGLPRDSIMQCRPEQRRVLIPEQLRRLASSGEDPAAGVLEGVAADKG